MQPVQFSWQHSNRVRSVNSVEISSVMLVASRGMVPKDVMYCNLWTVIYKYLKLWGKEKVRSYHLCVPHVITRISNVAEEDRECENETM